MKPGRVLALAPLQIAQALVGLGAIAAVTRLMSAEEFGHYAMALSASMLGHTLLFTWAEAAAFRFLPAARAEGRVADHFATLLVLAVALSAVVLLAAAGALTLGVFDRGTAAIFAFAAGAAVLRFALRIARESDRASFAVGRYAAFETAYLLIGFAAGVALLLRFDLGAAAPFAGLLLAGALVALLDGPRLIAKARGGNASFARIGSYAAYGAPLALALAIDLGVQTAARFILASQAGASEVGAYAAAFGLARPLDLLFMAAGAAFSPLLLGAYEELGGDAIREPARNGVTLMAAIACPAAIGLALVAAPLSALLVGGALSTEAAAVLPWLALAGLFSGFNLYYLSEAFQLARRTSLRAFVMLAPGVVQLALTTLFAAHYGASGAAIAALAGAVIGSLLLCLVGRRFVALPLPFGQFARIAGATALMAIAVAAAPGNMLLIKVAAGVVAYAFGAIAFDVARTRTHLVQIFARLRLTLTPPEPTHAR